MWRIRANVRANRWCGVTRLAVVMAVVAAMSAIVERRSQQPIVIAVGVQMVMLALVAFAAHARLAADRPAPARLTTFYLVVAVGGALGGLLNGVVAPLLFNRVLEYALMIVAVPLLLLGLPSERRRPREASRQRRVRVLTGAVGLLVLAAVVSVVARGSLTALLVVVGVVLAPWPGGSPGGRECCASVLVHRAGRSPRGFRRRTSSTAVVPSTAA